MFSNHLKQPAYRALAGIKLFGPFFSAVRYRYRASDLIGLVRLPVTPSSRSAGAWGLFASGGEAPKVGAWQTTIGAEHEARARPRNGPFGKINKVALGWLAALAVAACAPAQPTPSATLGTVPQYVELSSGGTFTLNYTPWYIHTWQFTGPKGTRMGGGGPNAMPAREDGLPLDERRRDTHHEMPANAL